MYAELSQEAEYYYEQDKAALLEGTSLDDFLLEAKKAGAEVGETLWKSLMTTRPQIEFGADGAVSNIEVI